MLCFEKVLLICEWFLIYSGLYVDELKYLHLPLDYLLLDVHML